jgi:hypothetical protein
MVVVTLTLVGAVVGLWFYGADWLDSAEAPRLCLQHWRRLYLGMPEQDVRAILGKPASGALLNTADLPQLIHGDRILTWADKKSRVVVIFRQGRILHGSYTSRVETDDLEVLLLK